MTGVVREARHVYTTAEADKTPARDIQQLEMIPVGPLNSKHVATSISPWIITPDALEPYRRPARAKEHAVGPHLDDPDGKALAVSVQVSVASGNNKPVVVGHTTVQEMDWTFEQLVAHQSSAGCGMRTGDLLGIGTISGPGVDEQGCLLEEFVPGKTAKRGWLQDGESVELVGYCGEGVGFGACIGTIQPTLDTSVWHSS